MSARSMTTCWIWTSFARVRAAEGDRPIFLMGNSMGGLIVCRWTILRKPQIAGLIMTGPLLALSDGLYHWQRHLAAPAGAVVPWLRVPRIPFAWLARSAEAVADFRNDPLVCHCGFTVRLAAQILRTVKDLSDRTAALDVPLLVLHGGDDHICDPAGSRALYRNAASIDKTLQVYDGLYHEILDEPKRNRVLADLIAWLDRHASRKAAATCPIELAR